MGYACKLGNIGGIILNPQKIYESPYDAQGTNTEINVTPNNIYICIYVSYRNNQIPSVDGGDVIFNANNPNGARYGRGGYYTTMYNYMVIFKANQSIIKVQTNDTSGYHYQGSNVVLVQLN